MVFNSLSFALFSPSVCALYWAFGTHRLRVQNAFILAASYLFYGFWDARFLSLIIVSSLVDFLLGQAIYNSQSSKTRGRLLFLSCLTNLGMLGVFKYFNFFVESAREAFTLLGLTVPNLSLERLCCLWASASTHFKRSLTPSIFTEDNSNPNETPWLSLRSFRFFLSWLQVRSNGQRTFYPNSLSQGLLIQIHRAKACAKCSLACSRKSLSPTTLRQ